MSRDIMLTLSFYVFLVQLYHIFAIRKSKYFSYCAPKTENQCHKIVLNDQNSWTSLSQHLALALNYDVSIHATKFIAQKELFVYAHKS